MDNLTLTDLRKILHNHNKTLKKKMFKLSGGRAKLLEIVKKNFKVRSKTDKVINIIHKGKQSSYILNITGSEARTKEDKKFKDKKTAKKTKAIVNKEKREGKKKEELEKERVKIKAKVLKDILIKEMKKKNKNKKKIKIVEKKLTALERQRKMLEVKKTPDIKAVSSIQPKIKNNKELTLPKMPPALVKGIKKGLKSMGLNDAKTINGLLGRDIKAVDKILFSCTPAIYMIMTLSILKEYKNDCIILNKDIKIDKNGVMTPIISNRDLGDWLRYGITYTRGLKWAGMSKKEFLKQVVGCLDRNNLAIVTLSLRGHANLIVFNANTMEISRYEPHGDQTGLGDNGKKSKRINTLLKNALKTFKYKGEPFKVLGSDDTCPVIMIGTLKNVKKLHFDGLQTFTGAKRVSPEEVKGGDPGGFCCIWSLFIMDLQLKYPKESVAALRVRGQKVLNAFGRSSWDTTKNNEIRRFVRNYTAELQKASRGIFEEMNLSAKQKKELAEQPDTEYYIDKLFAAKGYYAVKNWVFRQLKNYAG